MRPVLISYSIKDKRVQTKEKELKVSAELEKPKKGETEENSVARQLSELMAFTEVVIKICKEGSFTVTPSAPKTPELTADNPIAAPGRQKP